MGPALAVYHRAGAKRAVGFWFMHQDGLEVFRPLRIAQLAKGLFSLVLSGHIMIDIDNAEALHVVHVAGLSFGDLDSCQRVGAEEKRSHHGDDFQFLILRS